MARGDTFGICYDYYSVYAGDSYHHKAPRTLCAPPEPSVSHVK